MKIIALVLWIVGWSISVSLCNYIDAKTKELLNIPQNGIEAKKFNDVVNFFIWVVVSIGIILS